MATAMRLISAGRGVNVRGRDIGKSLVTLMEKLGGKSKNLIQPMFMAEIEEWRERELSKAQESRKGPINDRADCLIVFARSAKDKEGAVAYAKHLFAQEGPVNLMTGHKSKGLEFKDVFYLDSHLIPSKYAARMAAEGDETQLQQERNLNYVIITRSQENLTFISSDCYEVV
jgi:superfamily I DNA/RNA helicase